MKKKHTTALLAFFFGVLGLHRFYLNQKPLGFLYFAFFVISIIITANTFPPIPFFLMAIVIAIMDGILFAVMPKSEFNKKYNSKTEPETYSTPPSKIAYTPSETVPKGRRSNDFQYYKRKGIEAYRDQFLEDAVIYFNDALDLNPEDPAIHFNLACCHSRLEEPMDAFFHLEKAVEYGFDDLDKIQSHKALAFIRSTEDFELFVANGYQSKPLDLPNLNQEDDLLDQLNQSQSQQLLEKIKQLAELRDKGILTEEEFAEQKRRLLKE